MSCRPRTASGQLRGAVEAPVIGAVLATMRAPPQVDVANLPMSFVYGDETFERLREQLVAATKRLSVGAGRDARAGGGGMAEQPNSSVVLLVSKRQFDELGAAGGQRDMSRDGYRSFGEIAAYTVTHPDVHVEIIDSRETGIGLQHESTVTIKQPGVKPPGYLGPDNLYEDAKAGVLKDGVVTANVWTGQHKTNFQLHALIEPVGVIRGAGMPAATDTVLNLRDPCFAPTNLTTFCVATRVVGADGVAVYEMRSLESDSHYYVNGCGLESAIGDAAHAQMLFACVALSPPAATDR